MIEVAFVGHAADDHRACPRSSGCRACSTEARKASTSRWRIRRVVGGRSWSRWGGGRTGGGAGTKGTLTDGERPGCWPPWLCFWLSAPPGGPQSVSRGLVQAPDPSLAAPGCPRVRKAQPRGPASLVAEGVRQLGQACLERGDPSLEARDPCLGPTCSASPRTPVGSAADGTRPGVRGSVGRPRRPRGSAAPPRTMRSKRPGMTKAWRSVSGCEVAPTSRCCSTAIVRSISSSRKSMIGPTGRSGRRSPISWACENSSSSKNTVRGGISASAWGQAWIISPAFLPAWTTSRTRRGTSMSRKLVWVWVASAPASRFLPLPRSPISSMPVGGTVPQRS